MNSGAISYNCDSCLADYFISAYREELLGIIRDCIRGGRCLCFCDIPYYGTFISSSGVDCGVLDRYILGFIDLYSYRLGYLYYIVGSGGSSISVRFSRLGIIRRIIRYVRGYFL